MNGHSCLKSRTTIENVLSSCLIVERASESELRCEAAARPLQHYIPSSYIVYCIVGEERKRPSVIKMSKQRQASALAAHAPLIAVDDKLSEEEEKEKELIKK